MEIVSRDMIIQDDRLSRVLAELDQNIKRDNYPEIKQTFENIWDNYPQDWRTWWVTFRYNYLKFKKYGEFPIDIFALPRDNIYRSIPNINAYKNYKKALEYADDSASYMINTEYRNWLDDMYKNGKIPIHILSINTSYIIGSEYGSEGYNNAELVNKAMKTDYLKRCFIFLFEIENDIDYDCLYEMQYTFIAGHMICVEYPSKVFGRECVFRINDCIRGNIQRYIDAAKTRSARRHW